MNLVQDRQDTCIAISCCLPQCDQGLTVCFNQNMLHLEGSGQRRSISTYANASVVSTFGTESYQVAVAPACRRLLSHATAQDAAVHSFALKAASTFTLIVPSGGRDERTDLPC